MTNGMTLIESIRSGRQVPPPGIVTLQLDRGEEWIDTIAPGHARIAWDVEPRYFNLENAVICSWISCLIDQAIFYATNTLVEGDRVTRIEDMHLTFMEPVSVGRITIDAHVERVLGDRMWCRCEVRLEDGSLAVKASSVSLVTPAA